MKKPDISLKLAELADFLAPFRERHWLVGVSGGADSICLASLLNEVRPAKLTAIYFEHHLRSTEGELDGELVAEFCRTRQIEFRKIDLQVALSGSIEENAREARFAEWRKLHTEFPNSIVLLAHNSGDRRENLILRLMRGGNASSLTNLRKNSHLGELTILRPLLDFEREEIESILQERSIPWRNDATNSDNCYDRNYLRNVFFNRFPAKRFDAALEALQMDAEALELLANKAINPYLKQLETPMDFWQKLLPAIRHRALRLYLRDFVGEKFIPGSAFAREFGDLISGNRRKLRIDKTLHWSIRDGFLILNRTERKKSFALPLSGAWESGCFADFFSFEIVDKWKECKLDVNQAAFDYAKLPKILTISTPEAGDKMPLYPNGRIEKLKKLRIDRKAPPETPVLRLPSNEIIWYLGVRHSNFAPALPDRKTVVFQAKQIDKTISD